MLLTTKQVAAKLGVNNHYVSALVLKGKLPCANAEKKAVSDKRTHYEFDSRVVNEFKKTFVPPAPRKPKTVINGNGHAPDMLPLDIPTIVALQARLDRIEAMQARLGSIEEKLDELLAVWK